MFYMTSPYDKNAELKLIADTLRGNSEAFRPLVEGYWNLVCSVIRRYVKNQESIVDIAQEVFLNAFAKLSQYKPEFSFPPWLVKIAINKSIEFLRKENRSPFVDFDLEFTACQKLSPENIADQNQFFDACLERLPEKLQILFILRHGVDFSYEDMAYVLDLPVGTVKGAMFRIRNQLKTHFASKERREQVFCDGGQTLDQE